MRVLEGQSLFDIAIQSCGSAEAAFDLAVLNGVSLTDEVFDELELSDILNVEIASFFKTKNIQLATATVKESERIYIVADTIIRDSAMQQSNFICVASGQTLFDIALSEFGSVDAAFELADINDLNVTDDLYSGQLLKKTFIVNKSIHKFYKQRCILPATWFDGEHSTFDNTFDFTFF